MSELANAELGRLSKAAGRWSMTMDTTLGTWNGVSASQMAKDLGEEGGYVFNFGRLSDSVHGSWRDLTRYHLALCLNPLHGGHHLADYSQSSAGVVPVVTCIEETSRALGSVLALFAPVDDPAQGQVADLRKQLHDWIGEHLDESTGLWHVEVRRDPSDPVKEERQ